MTDDDLRAFMFGKVLYVFEPATRARFAAVQYGADYTCHARFEDGSEDTGTYGFEGEHYWTRYLRFRDGTTHYFFLVPLAPDTAQAFYQDGTQAFLQSTKADPRSFAMTSQLV